MRADKANRKGCEENNFLTANPSEPQSIIEPELRLYDLPVDRNGKMLGNFWGTGLLGVATSFAQRLISRFRLSGTPPIQV